MLIVLISLLISFGISTLAYRFFEQRSKGSEMTRVRRRLGVETEAERLAATDVPSLIRSGERKEPWWVRTFAPHLRINERLSSLIESAGLQSTPESVQKTCAVWAVLAAGLTFLAGNQLAAILA